MKRILILFIIIIPAALSALTMEQGNLKVVVDQNTGGFLLYGRTAESADWQPLLVESYTSSYLEISLNGIKSILNSNRNYDIRLEQNEGEVVIIYDGPQVRVEDHIVFIEANEGVFYLALTAKIINTGSDTAAIGLKRVLDTDFKKGGIHYTALGKNIDKETLYLKDSMPDQILSEGAQPGEMLYIHPMSSAQNPPSRLLLANWNRIDTKEWDYTPKAGTNFNSLPFSINDSALALYWDLGALSSGKSMETSLALGNLDFSNQSIAGSAVPVVSKNSVSPKRDLSQLHMEEQLDYLYILLNDIDRLLEKGQDVTNDEILTVESRLEILEQKKRDYEELQ